MELIISKKAFLGIKKECLKHPEVETGGIIVGKCNSHEIIAPFVIGSGPLAHRSITRFEPDVYWQQGSLEEYFNDYGLNYVGSFHRHFGDFNSPSCVDFNTARQILSDPDWAVSQIVFPIILFKGNDIEIYPYYISRDNPEFQLITLGVLPDDHPLLKSLAKRGDSLCQKSLC